MALIDDDHGSGGFHGPSLGEFFPPAILFEGTPFELNRIMLIRIIITVLLIVWLLIATRRMRIVPSRGQVANEFILGFIRNNMPRGTDPAHPQLSLQEAWDVVAFLQSKPRPHFAGR